jgi:hypothetical protein
MFEAPQRMWVYLKMGMCIGTATLAYSHFPSKLESLSGRSETVFQVLEPVTQAYVYRRPRSVPGNFRYCTYASAFFWHILPSYHDTQPRNGEAPVLRLLHIDHGYLRQHRYQQANRFAEKTGYASTIGELNP